MQNGKPTLVCEACHHTEPVEKIDRSMVGRCCRICHEPVFTERDWRAWQWLQFWSWISRAMSFMGAPLKTYRVRVGGGKTEITER